MKHKGFSLVEILIALTVICFALIPIITMSSKNTQKAVFSEYHVFFQSRAVRLLQHYSILSYEDLKLLSTGSEGTIHVTLRDPPIPYEFRRKLKRSSETLTFEELEPGLGMLKATMQWDYPLDSKIKGRKHHQIELVRYVVDPMLSIKRRKGLEL